MHHYIAEPDTGQTDRMSDSRDPYHFERPPLLIVISGTSGAGKDSVARALVKRMEESGFSAHFVVTATSRPKREGEVGRGSITFLSPERGLSR